MPPSQCWRINKGTLTQTCDHVVTSAVKAATSPSVTEGEHAVIKSLPETMSERYSNEPLGPARLWQQMKPGI